MLENIIKLINDNASSLIGGLIAFTAVLIAVRTNQISREHNKLSVRPHVDSICSVRPNVPVSLKIINHGPGIALIDNLIFSFDGIEIGSLKQIAEIALTQNVGLKYDFHNISINTSLAVDSNVNLVTITNSNESIANHNNAVEFIHKLKFKLTYESIYKEKFSLCYP